ncbi:MAG: alternate-type signal peptide domain-containing protein [Bifidobacteriaceae bacterium]|jgi:alternate signal-mediated exported protein|nr:alternate-type signal peptide domain-containing protein [Bifidobacteriaceae bacterium]
MTTSTKTASGRRSLRTKALVAGAAGVALLLGGTTFATWSDSSTASPASVSHGKLDLVAEFSNPKLYDVSQDRVNKAGSVATLLYDNSGDAGGNEISASTFKAVPGDTVEVDLKDISVTLSGDNLKANLVLSATGASADNWTLTYKVFKWDTSAYVAISEDWATGSLSNLSSGVTIATNVANGAKYAVAISGTFDASNQTGVDGTLSLGTVTVALQQVR